ncbi:cobalamin B12-binding domain-containing protein [Solirubrobacter soli]|uniref:cobalamin B12-binding domain-containing protein n=1 Tax=Solirubrobacter soli TaxID=363832 RepID=UPI000483DD46|nr:cobalamin-dependent protein [Solirubrobacter soli]
MLRLRRCFTRALLAGDPDAAERAVREAMDGGLSAAQIDIELIAPALFIVGEKWALGEISIADEHLASEIALRVLALQREAQRNRRRRGRRRVLLLAPEGERHVIGLNMATDLLDAAGYDTRLLGADVPLADVAMAVTRHHADIVALTATMADSVERIDAAMDYLRHVHPRVSIVIGGSAVTFELGATWSASVCPDVSSVVDVVDALVHHAPLN